MIGEHREEPDRARSGPGAESPLARCPFCDRGTRSRLNGVTAMAGGLAKSTLAGGRLFPVAKRQSRRRAPSLGGRPWPARRNSGLGPLLTRLRGVRTALYRPGPNCSPNHSKAASCISALNSCGTSRSRVSSRSPAPCDSHTAPIFAYASFTDGTGKSASCKSL